LIVSAAVSSHLGPTFFRESIEMRLRAYTAIWYTHFGLVQHIAMGQARVAQKLQQIDDLLQLLLPARSIVAPFGSTA